MLRGKKCGGFKEEVPPETRTPNILQSQVRQDVLRTSPGGDTMMIKMNSGVTQNKFCTNPTVSFPTLVTTLLISEGQWPGLAHPEFSTDPLHVVGAWFTFS